MATLGQQVYEAVEGLKAKGVKGADAFKQVAKERGKTLSAVRGNYYSHARKLGSGGGGGTRGRRASRNGAQDVSYSGAVRQARELLQRALNNIDSEVESARQRLERAQAEYDEIVRRIGERKEELQRKIDALA